MQKIKQYAKIAIGTAMTLIPAWGARATTTLTPENLLPSDFQTGTGLGNKPLTATIASLINVVIGFLGIVAVVMILIGGFMWMTAGGSEEKIKKAKALIFQGIIGLVIILASYAIATFVISSLLDATTGV